MSHLGFLGLTAFLVVVPAWESRDLSDVALAEHAVAEFRHGVALRSEKDRGVPRFRQAVRDLAELSLRGMSNPTLYLSLGNAQLLGGDVAGAIVSYRVGLHFEPTSPHLRAALAAARNQVDYPIEGALGKQTPSVNTWTPASNSILALAFIAYVSACVVFTRWRMKRHRSLLVMSIAFFLAAVTTTGWGLMIFEKERTANVESWAVIKIEGQRLRKGNGWLSDGQPAFPARYATPLPIGVEARVLCERADWVQLELGGGEVGWLPKAAVLIV